MSTSTNTTPPPAPPMSITTKLTDDHLLSDGVSSPVVEKTPVTQPSDIRSPPNAPSKTIVKKPPSSVYAYFEVSQRERMLSDHPDMSLRDIMKALREEWKELSVEDRIPYKTAFKKAVNAWKLATGETLAKAPGKKKTAYNYFVADKERRAKIQEAHPDWKFGDIAKEISRQWKEMDTVARQPYIELAEKGDDPSVLAKKEAEKKKKMEEKETVRKEKAACKEAEKERKKMEKNTSDMKKKAIEQKAMENFLSYHGCDISNKTAKEYMLQAAIKSWAEANNGTVDTNMFCSNFKSTVQ